MPLIDMPLPQLATYQGINPRPADFDAYWSRALAEMRAMDPQVELALSDFTAPGVECFDLYFTGVRGARVHAKLLRPEGRRDCPAVLMFHGYTGNAGGWTEKLAYAQSGYVVAALDCRGQGGQSQDVGGVCGTTFKGHIIRGLDDPNPDRMLMRDIFLDTAQLADIVMDMPEVDAGRVGCTGGSQGGALTLACASLEPRIRRAAPAYPFLCDYKRVWEMDLAKDAYEEIRTFFRQFDPLHRRETELFEKLGYVDNQHLAPRIQARVLMACGLMDTVCPPSTQFAAYNKITAEKDVMIYPDYGHEGLPGWDDAVYQFMKGL